MPMIFDWSLTYTKVSLFKQIEIVFKYLEEGCYRFPSAVFLCTITDKLLSGLRAICHISNLKYLRVIVDENLSFIPYYKIISNKYDELFNILVVMRDVLPLDFAVKKISLLANNIPDSIVIDLNFINNK